MAEIPLVNATTFRMVIGHAEFEFNEISFDADNFQYRLGSSQVLSPPQIDCLYSAYAMQRVEITLSHDSFVLRELFRILDGKFNTNGQMNCYLQGGMSQRADGELDKIGWQLTLQLLRG